MNAQMAERYAESQHELYNILSDIWADRMAHACGCCYSTPIDPLMVIRIKDALGLADDRLDETAGIRAMSTPALGM